jgi:hypothetical protein
LSATKHELVETKEQMTEAKEQMTSKGANGKNKGTHDPIRRKPKRNMTPIRGNTTSDSVSNG